MVTIHTVNRGRFKYSSPELVVKLSKFLYQELKEMIANKNKVRFHCKDFSSKYWTDQWNILKDSWLQKETPPPPAQLSGQHFSLLLLRWDWHRRRGCLQSPPHHLLLQPRDLLHLLLHHETLLRGDPPRLAHHLHQLLHALHGNSHVLLCPGWRKFIFSRYSHRFFQKRKDTTASPAVSRYRVLCCRLGFNYCNSGWRTKNVFYWISLIVTISGIFLEELESSLPSCSSSL